jgi:hypothetical protein
MGPPARRRGVSPFCAARAWRWNQTDPQAGRAEMIPFAVVSICSRRCWGRSASADIRSDAPRDRVRHIHRLAGRALAAQRRSGFLPDPAGAKVA